MIQSIILSVQKLMQFINQNWRHHLVTAALYFLQEAKLHYKILQISTVLSKPNIF